MERPRVTDLPLADLRSGAALFDQGAAWEAHEVWERAWRGFTGGHRDYLKGLIQLAAVNHHLARGKRSAARRLLDTAVTHLERCRPLDWPFDTGHLLAACAATAIRLDQGSAVQPLELCLTRMFDAWVDRSPP